MNKYRLGWQVTICGVGDLLLVGTGSHKILFEPFLNCKKSKDTLEKTSQSAILQTVGKSTLLITTIKYKYITFNMGLGVGKLLQLLRFRIPTSATDVEQTHRQ